MLFTSTLAVNTSLSCLGAAPLLGKRYGAEARQRARNHLAAIAPGYASCR